MTTKTIYEAFGPILSYVNACESNEPSRVRIVRNIYEFPAGVTSMNIDLPGVSCGVNAVQTWNKLPDKKIVRMVPPKKSITGLQYVTGWTYDPNDIAALEKNPDEWHVPELPEVINHQYQKHIQEVGEDPLNPPRILRPYKQPIKKKESLYRGHVPPTEIYQWCVYHAEDVLHISRNSGTHPATVDVMVFLLN